ncbi:hypothetical protein [Burkholderia phage BCSR52]|uniref:Uncharacterized protein n=1 Tax=Burkholderia phage BCSR52 TaxID=2805748 RepID=A0A889IQ89_9CAUD|nr:hypothetical protein [Burkholderia phage BCSR52]
MSKENSRADTLTPEEIQDRLHRFNSKRNTTALTVVSVTEFIIELLAASPSLQPAAAPTPCVHANDPKACYRVRCQLGGKCVDDDMSPRTAPSPADERAAFAQFAKQQGYDLTTCEQKGVISTRYGLGPSTYWNEDTEHAWRGWANARFSANETGAEACKTCGRSRVVDDGEITDSGGVEFENGPIKCVKECPDCAAPQPAQASGIVEAIASQWDGCMFEGIGHDINIGAAIRDAWKRLSGTPAQADARVGLTAEQVVTIRSAARVLDDARWPNLANELRALLQGTNQS